VEKAARIRAQLAKLYPKPAIPLDHTNHFQLLVAVMLSAQSTDKKVNEVTPALFAAAGDAAAMAALDVAAIEAAIKQVGLAPTKAKNVRATAQALLERHGGAVPRTFAELEALPGVGHKTASVVMAQAFGLPAFPVDTHIHRLAQRWGLVATPESGRPPTVEATERDLKALWPPEAWVRFFVCWFLFCLLHLVCLRGGRAGGKEAGGKVWLPYRPTKQRKARHLNKQLPNLTLLQTLPHPTPSSQQNLTKSTTSTCRSSFSAASTAPRSATTRWRAPSARGPPWRRTTGACLCVFFLERVCMFVCAKGSVFFSLPTLVCSHTDTSQNQRPGASPAKAAGGKGAAAAKGGGKGAKSPAQSKRKGAVEGGGSGGGQAKGKRQRRGGGGGGEA
jgi:endonuclease-3